MDSKTKHVSPSVYAIIGPEGSTNFSIVKGRKGSAVLIDADIRRIDEIEETLQLSGCAEVAGDLLYAEVHPVTFFGNIPNWPTALKPPFDSHYKKLVPGHGPTVDDEGTGRSYFKKTYDYLADFHGRLQEIKSGRESTDEVARHMLHGTYAGLGKTRMVERNINQFLTGRRY